MTEEICREVHLMECVEDDQEVEVFESEGWLPRRNKNLNKNQVLVDKFLGNQTRIFATGELPAYYRGLLAWALQQYLQRSAWKIIATFSYRQPEPFYTDVETGKEKINLLIDGQMLIEKDNTHFVLTVDIGKNSLLQLDGAEIYKTEMTQFINDVLDITKKENFYRAKNIEFNGDLRFLDVKNRTWQSVVLDCKVKTEIMTNTIDFLNNSERWIQYGIPLKRGVLLAGEPGTGKTIICKVLMAEAKGITCITTSAYLLNTDEYITELYKLAEDLSPCIVFIEDIDLIGLDRFEFGYQRGPALLSLLAVLDGIEEKNNIVTVATTNNLEMLDKALCQRPSRFDRIIKLSLPTLLHRGEIVRRLCLKIPLPEEIQGYISTKSENCTPAQVQEIVFSLAIHQSTIQNNFGSIQDEIDSYIATIHNKNRKRIGFNATRTSHDDM